MFNRPFLNPPPGARPGGPAQPPASDPYGRLNQSPAVAGAGEDARPTGEPQRMSNVVQRQGPQLNMIPAGAGIGESPV